eukprot:258623_1
MLLTKAFNKHRIAISDIYKQQLLCKYYKKEFNIIRNELIAIRHILALVVYTDMSEYCTVFRKTYRRIDDEITDEEVLERHLQLYYFARTLYESVEFFGEEMVSNFEVYHGLNKVMYFQKFTAYFHQPMSTTPSKAAARLFARATGIILHLKSGSEIGANISNKPKYLSVSFLSDFPHEEELLFYGNVIFKISDITEGSNLKGHRNELLILNKFQRIVKNQSVVLKDTKKMVSGLEELITNQKQINKKKIKKNKKQIQKIKKNIENN